MRTRLLVVPALLAAAAGVAHTQPAAPPLVPDIRAQITPPAAPALPVVPSLIPAGTVPSLPPADIRTVAEKSIDELLNQLEGLRARQAELARQEHELVKDIRRKLEQQGERVRQLGVGPAPAAAPLVGPPAPPGLSFGGGVMLLGGN